MAETLEKRARRKVHYASMSDFLSDVEQLAATRVQTVGDWTFAQILQHLADAIRMSFDGYDGFKIPWFARKLIAPFVKNRFLTKPMPAGFKLPKDAQALLPSPQVKLDDSLANLRREIARLGTGGANDGEMVEKEMAPHPFLGRLALQEWKSFHLRHAELHMSFVVPIDG